MKRRLVPVLLLLLLLSGCRSAPAAPESAPVTVPPVPATAQPAPAPAASAAPAPPSTWNNWPPGLAPVCDKSADRREILKALQSYLSELLKGAEPAEAERRIMAEPSTCLRVSRAKEADIFLVEGGLTSDRGYVLAWQSGREWRVERLNTGWQISILAAKLVDGRPDVLLLYRSTAATVRDDLYQFRVDAAGKPSLAEVARGAGKLNVRSLRSDLLLVTYVSRQLAYDFPDSCSGCVPSREQLLLGWDGKAFMTDARRTYSEPELTLNLLRKTLQDGDRKAAARYVSDPGLLERAESLLPKGTRDYQTFTDVRAIAEIEEFTWEALPAEFRKELPPALQTHVVLLRTADGPGYTRLERRPEGWIVTGIGLSGLEMLPGPNWRPTDLEDLEAKALATLSKARRRRRWTPSGRAWRLSWTICTAPGQIRT